MRAYATGVALGVFVGWLAVCAQAAPLSVEQVLRGRELDPVRTPDRVETAALEPPKQPLATTPVTPDVAAELSRILMSPASYLPQAPPCDFLPEFGVLFHRGGDRIEVAVSFACSALVFTRAGDARNDTVLSFRPVEKELLDFLRLARPGDAQLEAVPKLWNERARQVRLARERWAETMPESLRPFWSGDSPEQSLTFVPNTATDPGRDNAEVKFLDADVGALQLALARQLPDVTTRIRALLRWYGSGTGPWSGYPSYEVMAARLLLGHRTTDLVSAVQAEPLTPEQVEGTARLFAGWEFSRERPNDAKRLPAALRAQLLEHVLASPDPDKRTRGAAAFGKR